MLSLGLSQTSAAVRGRIGGPPASVVGTYFAPTSALGLNGVSDFTVAWPFLNIMKMSRNWTNSLDYNSLPRDGVTVTTDGYPKAIPGGSTFLRTVWDVPDSVRASLLAHEHTLIHNGDIDVSVANASIVGTGASGTKITPTGSALFELRVTAIRTAPTSMHLVRTDRLTAFNAGQTFNPDYLDTIRGTGLVRFMDWQRTNSNTAENWADRTKPTDCNGVSLEDCLALMNEISADGWFCVPAKANDACVDAMAALLRDGTSRKVWVEYGNEAWNTSLGGGMFYNHTITKSQDDWNGGAAWPSEPWARGWSWYGKRFAQIVDRFDAVFAGQSGRLRRVLAVQTTANPSGTTTVQNNIHAPHWQQFEPASYVPPASRADYVALTWYYGSGITGDSGDGLTRSNAILAAYGSGTPAEITASNDLIHGYLRNASNGFSVEAKIAMLTEWNTLANTYGFKLCFYEGGNHTQQSYAPPLAPMLAYRKSALDRLNVEALWDATRGLSNFAAPFMQYVEIGTWSVHGFWAIWESLPTLGGTTWPVAQGFIDKTKGEPAKWWTDPVYPRIATTPVISGPAAPSVDAGTASVGNYTANVAGYFNVTGANAALFSVPPGLIAAGANVPLSFLSTSTPGTYNVTVRMQALNGAVATYPVTVTVNAVAAPVRITRGAMGSVLLTAPLATTLSSTSVTTMAIEAEFYTDGTEASTGTTRPIFAALGISVVWSASVARRLETANSRITPNSNFNIGMTTGQVAAGYHVLRLEMNAAGTLVGTDGNATATYRLLWDGTVIHSSTSPVNGTGGTIYPSGTDYLSTGASRFAWGGSWETQFRRASLDFNGTNRFLLTGPVDTWNASPYVQGAALDPVTDTLIVPQIMEGASTTGTTARTVTFTRAAATNARLVLLVESTDASATITGPAGWDPIYSYSGTALAIAGWTGIATASQSNVTYSLSATGSTSRHTVMEFPAGATIDVVGAVDTTNATTATNRGTGTVTAGPTTANNELAFFVAAWDSGGSADAASPAHDSATNWMSNGFRPRIAIGMGSNAFGAAPPKCLGVRRVPTSGTSLSSAFSYTGDTADECVGVIFTVKP